MANWSDSTWNGREDRRFRIFKEQNPNATFHYNGEALKIKHANTWDEVKLTFGIKTGSKSPKNPLSVGMLIDTGDGKLRKLTDIERYDVRVPGTKAESMEAMVTIATLADIKSYKDFLEITEDESKLESLIQRVKGVSKDDINKILHGVEFNHDYGEHFIKIGQNALNNLTFNGSVENYYAMSKSNWDKLKKSVANKIIRGLDGNKWNPADILLVQNGFDVNSLFNGDVQGINQKFDKAVDDKQVIPISVKKTEDAIKGSRGISREIEKAWGIVSLKKYIGSKIEGVPVYVIAGSSLVPNTDTQREVLSWIINKGIKHVEYTAGVALGYIDESSVWWVINDKTATFYTRKSKKKLKLKEIIISLKSDAVWLIFENEFLLVRRKGGSSIHVSAEGTRDTKGRTDNIKELTLKQPAIEELLESFLL